MSIDRQYPQCRLPYFDALLGLLDDYPALEQSFGRHVHWGYWENPPIQKPDVVGFAEATEQLSRLVCDAACVGEGQSILDVGCGFGGTLFSLDGRYSNLKLHGLNTDIRQLARAKAIANPAQTNRLDWINADACKLPFADETFDAVTAVECIFHFPSRREFFREAFRVLKPGGGLALSDFLSTALLRPLAWLIRHWPTSSGFYGQCDVQYGFKQYRQLALDTGFNLRVERDITHNTLPTYDYLHELRKQIPYSNVSAALETLFLENTSRLGMMRYAVLGFEKPASGLVNPKG